MAGTGAVSVKGLSELDRAFGQISKELRTGTRKELRAIAEPVRVTATELALSGIRNMDEHWARMRLGVSARAVYMVPASRRKSGSSPRPNLAELLMGRAMEPSLEAHTDEIVAGMELWVDRLGGEAGF